MNGINVFKLVLLAALFQCGAALSVPAANLPVTMPPNPKEMQPLATTNTPADRAAQWFKRGVNLGDHLEATPRQGRVAATVSADAIAQMKREGFDHLRVPIGWHHYAGPAPNFTLTPEIFGRVDFIVTNALKDGLAVMINIHHFNELDKDPVAGTPEFLAIWKQIAAHYAKFPDRLAFELDNEPHENATTELMNPIYAKVIALIRQTNPDRTIFVEPGGWGSIGELKNLVLPPDDNLIISVHCYEPFHFTHQGASWTPADVQQTGVIFPGPPTQPLVADPKLNPKPYVLDWIRKYNTLPTAENPSSAAAFTDQLKFLRVWSDYYRYPVHLGEFGAYIKADQTSRARYYEAFRRATEAENLGWAIWDWDANFRYWDRKAGQPMPGMHDALFGKSN